MEYFVAVTDDDWFEFLAQRQPDEVNFWRPSGQGFGAVDTGAPFLFKLHSPNNYIVGGGFFVKFIRLPLSMAWDAFDEKNGAATYQSFREQILKYRQFEEDPEIGCIILAEPFFFPPEYWIPQPKDWQPNIVQGKTYDTQDTVGRNVWEQIAQNLRIIDWMPTSHMKEDMPSAVDTLRRYGPERLVTPRLGQGAFRILVTDAYNRRCAVTGERTLPALDASHIKPYAESGPHQVRNGLLLRADIHRLFDYGYMTLTKDLHVEVSRRIKEEFDNGREYYHFHGQKLIELPSSEIDHPSPDYITWHNENIYMG